MRVFCKLGFHEARRYFLRIAVGKPLRQQSNSRLQSLGYEIAVHDADSARRDPPWTRDELILALDCYVQHGGQLVKKYRQNLKFLSELLNRFQQLLMVQHARMLKNTNGVYMNLMDFRRFDPMFTG